MKKPITIGVIAVIATILVTSAIDYSAIGAKPIDQIRLQTSSSFNDGEMSCPNGNPIQTELGTLRFTEHIENESRGRIHQSNNNNHVFEADLWGGSIQSNQFTFTGIGNPGQVTAQFCGEVWPVEQAIVTVWGECGQGVTVHFESELGYSGSFTGNVLCV